MSALNHSSSWLPLPRWPHWFIHFHASLLWIWNMPLQTHHENSPKLPRAYGSFSFHASALLSGHICLITCPPRWPDTVWLWLYLRSALKKARARLSCPPSLPLFFSLFFLEPATRAGADATVNWHHYRGEFSYIRLHNQMVFVVVEKGERRVGTVIAQDKSAARSWNSNNSCGQWICQRREQTVPQVRCKLWREVSRSFTWNGYTCYFLF